MQVVLFTVSVDKRAYHLQLSIICGYPRFLTIREGTPTVCSNKTHLVIILGRDYSTVCNKHNDLFLTKSLPDYHKAAITWKVHHSKAVSRKQESK
jgi:hypothetical protein